MILRKAVIFASILVAMFSAISALPGIIRERHVIHAPIKIKTIHHYRLQKIPVIIRKHLHFYRPREEDHLNPDLEDHHGNQVFQEEEDDHDGFRPRPKGPSSQESSEDSEEAPEEDYEGPSREEDHEGPSREEEYENYEYE